MIRRINAFYYDGQTAYSHTIQLEIDEQGNLQAFPPLVEVPNLKEAKLSSRVGNIARVITLADGATIEIADHDGLDQWLNHFAIEQGLVHKFESSMPYVVSSVAVLALFIAWTFFYGIPWFSAVTAKALPAEASIYIGQGTLETMDERIFTESKLDPVRQQQLTDQFYQLLPDPKNNGEIKYRLLFRGGGFIGANAFALPDGTVLLTDELVALAENDEEILTVLLHEIGHVEHRHSLRQVISHSGLAVITLLISGDVNSASSMILALPNILMNSSYSRDLEWEADSYALERMQKIGIPPSRFADFMQRLEFSYDIDEEDQTMETCPRTSSSDEADDNLSWDNYLSSHPPSSERVNRFRQNQPVQPSQATDPNL